MVGCTISECGGNPSFSGVLVQGGFLNVQNCIFSKNESHAIVIDNVNGKSSPHLKMDGCEVIGNGAGILFGTAGGSGLLSRNEINNNAIFGVGVFKVLKGKKVKLLHNKYENNGASGISDILTKGNAKIHNKDAKARVSKFNLLS
ncbi:hypothetical protein HK096_010496, partial [Nowakowskiella sp. JEL0078]